MKNIKKDHKASGAGAMLLVVIILVTILFGYALITIYTERDLNYRTEIHSHVVNARYSQDPTVIKSELIAAKQGMIDAGLTNDTYGRFWAWNKTPDNSMEWQYKQLDQAIGMCDMLIVMDKDTASYGAALTNLQNYIYDENGWADEVAERAYALNNYAFVTVYVWFIIAILLVAGAVGFIILLD